MFFFYVKYEKKYMQHFHKKKKKNEIEFELISNVHEFEKMEMEVKE